MEESQFFNYENEALLFLQQKIYDRLYTNESSGSFIRDETIELTNQAHLISEVAVKVGHRDDVAEILLPKFKYAIKNEDIKLFDALLDGLKAAASAHFILDITNVQAVIGIVAAIIKLGRDSLKGVSLDDKELSILVILKKYGPIELSEIINTLSSETQKFDETLLIKLLGNLSQKRTLIGTNISLISKTTDGRWVTAI